LCQEQTGYKIKIKLLLEALKIKEDFKPLYHGLIDFGALKLLGCFIK